MAHTQATLFLKQTKQYLKQTRHYLSSSVLMLTLAFCYSAQAMDKTALSSKLTEQAQNKILQTINNHPKTFKALRTEQNPKLSSRLSKLMLEQKTAAFKPDPMLRYKSDNVVQVYINVANIDDRTREKLQNEGVDVELLNAEMGVAQGWVSVNDLSELASKSWVSRIKEPVYPTFNRGSRLTEGDAILRSNLVREAGITGKGIKVGILSDGANDWPQARASGDLPDNVTTFGNCTIESEDLSQCRFAGTCNEGTAMAEIIHDIAPEAELAVAAVGTSLEFINQLNVLANTFQADVIVDDIGFFGEPYFEDGDIALAVNSLTEDILYFSSAGNSNGIHYEANFSPVSEQNLLFHDFDISGVEDLDQGFAINPNSSSVVLLQWSDSFNNASSDYDLFIIDEDGNIVTSSNSVGPLAFEAVCVPNLTSDVGIFFAIVIRFAGESRRLEMFHLGSAAIQYETEADAIFGHAATERAIAVAAINAADPDNDTAEFFSSRGPSTVFFPQFEVRQKPDIAAIDGVSVTGTGGFPSTFFGTSAAAPHAAGVAALLLSAGPMVKPETVREALTSTAIGGVNNVLGFGRIDAELALAELAIGNPLPAIILLLNDDE